MALSVKRVRTTDVEAAHAALAAVYGGGRPLSLSGTGTGFRLDLRMADGDVIGADRVHEATSAQCDMHLPETFVVTLCTGGSIEARADGGRARLSTGTVACCPNDGFHALWDDMRADTVRMPMATVRRVAEERCGLPQDALRVRPAAITTGPGAVQWRELNDHVQRELSAPESSLAEPLVEAAYADLIAAVALTVFPNNAVTAERGRDPGWSAPATVRRAVEFMDANAGRAITLTDVAQAAGVSARAVQIAFRRHRGMTPMAYLRRVRLEHAHRELETTDPRAGVTVAAVAARHGFGHAARFAQFYRATYGVLPSETLRGPG